MRFFLKYMESAKLTFMKSNQSGNVLFYILIAVALLAALSFATTQGTRGGGGQISKEQARLNAVEMIEYGNILTQAASQLRLRGYADTEISFENSAVAGYGNSNCTDNACLVFHPDGGGVSHKVPNDGFLDQSQSAQTRFGEWWVTGESCVPLVGTGENCWNENGATDSDLILVLPWIKRDICIAINKALGIDTDPIPRINNQPWGTSMVRFTGTYTTSGHAVQSNQTDPLTLRGTYAGCFEGHNFPAIGSYAFFSVLLAR